MQLKLATESDVKWVRENLHPSYDEHFPFPDLSQAITTLVLKEKDEIVAFACLRNILEGIIMLSGDNRQRIKMLDAILPQSKYFAAMTGHNGYHAFVKGEFGKVLENHYGFKKTDDCLYLGV